MSNNGLKTYLKLTAEMGLLLFSIVAVLTIMSHITSVALPDKILGVNQVTVSGYASVLLMMLFYIGLVHRWVKTEQQNIVKFSIRYWSIFYLLFTVANLVLAYALPDIISSSDISPSQLADPSFSSTDKEIAKRFIPAAILSCILVPISEELIYRSLIQRHLYFRTRNHFISIFLAAVIFSLMHLTYDPWPSFLNAEVYFSHFVAGLLLSYSYYKTSNLLYPLSLHIMQNSVSYVFYGNNEHLENFVVIGVLLLNVLGFYAICSIFLKKRVNTNVEKI